MTEQVLKKQTLLGMEPAMNEVWLGRAEALAYEISRGGKHVTHFGPWTAKSFEAGAELLEKLRDYCQRFKATCHIEVTQDDRGYYYVILYKHQWALEGFKWMALGPGRLDSLDQRQRDWILGLLFGYGGQEIQDFCDNRIKSGWYAEREAAKAYQIK